jgi:hypothetical protein
VLSVGFETNAEQISAASALSTQHSALSTAVDAFYLAFCPGFC